MTLEFINNSPICLTPYGHSGSLCGNLCFGWELGEILVD